MDPVTTGIGAALIAKALPEEWRGPIGVWVMTGAALFPDIDIIASRVTGDPLATMTFHRGYTHSFFGVLTLAPLLALIAWAVRKDKSYKRLLGLCALALVWHIFTDVPTTWGTIIFWPFSWHRAAWDWIFILDLYYTGLLLAPQLLVWIYLRRNGRQWLGTLWRAALIWFGLTGMTHWLLTSAARALDEPFGMETYVGTAVTIAVLLSAPALFGWGFRQSRATFARIGLAGFVFYVALAGVSHTVALGRVNQQVAERGWQAERVAALPQPLSPFRWSGMVLTPEGVYRNFFRVFDSSLPEFSLTPSEANEFIEQARQVPAVQTYLWFARFPVARYQNAGEGDAAQHTVEFGDLRFGLPGDDRPRFSFRVVFNAGGDVLSAGFPGTN